MSQGHSSSPTGPRSGPLRIAINAQLSSDGTAGGIEQFVAGLIYSLGQLQDGEEQYVVIGPNAGAEWLTQWLGPNSCLTRGPSDLKGLLGSRLGLLRKPVRSVYKLFRRLQVRKGWSRGRYPVSDGFYESLGCAVIHFPYQSFVHTALPSVYNPHDLQHRHYPRFFDKEALAYRDALYSAGCGLAAAVATESVFVRQDVVGQYGIEPSKVLAIPRGSPTELYAPPPGACLPEVRNRYGLPDGFCLYPAQTWPHKNHIRLLDAIALVRDSFGLRMGLVCTGRRNDFWPAIRRRIHELNLESQVFFLGYVPAVELRALYRLTEFVVFPSLFEGGGFPVLEAFSEGAPVACSDVTSLPEYAGDAALLFDPRSVESIAQALHRMTCDAELRERLRQQGTNRIRCFSWARTAKTYRAVYRRVAGLDLSEEDQCLLAESDSPLVLKDCARSAMHALPNDQ